MRNINYLKLQGLIGLIVPLLTLGYKFFLGTIKPGYNRFTMTISSLGSGNSTIASLVSLLFITTGIFLVYFANGLKLVLKDYNTYNIGLFIIFFFVFLI